MSMEHPIKNLYRRFRYGAGCCDTYSLYYWLSCRLSKAIRQYEKDADKVIVIDDEFRRSLQEMIFAFDYFGENIEEKSEELENRAQMGVEQFAKMFRRLWW